MTTTKPPRIANTDSRDYVHSRKPFRGSNLYAEWVSDRNEESFERYVVYSYGEHWPLFIYDVQLHVWFENISWYSVSTSKQKSQCNPHAAAPIQLSAEQMKRVVRVGPVGLIEEVV